MRDVLLVIDMQNDFCQPTADRFVAGAPNAITRVIDAVAAFREAGVPVVFVKRLHCLDSSDVDRSRRELFARRPFLVDSPGADLVAGLAIEPGDYLGHKRRWSAFFGTDLNLLLRRLDIDRLYLTGVQTPNCIRATAYDANARDYDCVVLSDATASATAVVQQANLFDMANMGVGIQTTAEVRSALRGRTAANA